MKKNKEGLTARYNMIGEEIEVRKASERLLSWWVGGRIY